MWRKQANKHWDWMPFHEYLIATNHVRRRIFKGGAVGWVGGFFFSRQCKHIFPSPFHPPACSRGEVASHLPHPSIHTSVCLSVRPSPTPTPPPCCHAKQSPPPPPPPQFINKLFSSLSWRMCSIKADRLPVFPERCRGLSPHAQISGYERSVTGRPSFEDSDSSTDASQLEI